MIGRLIALLVVTVLGVYYIVFDAVGVQLGAQPYTVHVELPAAGGIYSDASVSYRGVDVGKVSAVHLRPNGVVVDLAIQHGVHIPADAHASVRELTAAAEQYLDLVPPNTDPPFLHNGSTIPMADTSIPTSIGTLLNSVNSLVSSLHASDINTISRSLAEGLQGAGDDLRSLIADSHTLLSALQSSIPGTVQVIDAGHTVLSTLDSTGGEFLQFSHNLNLLSQEVAQSNHDLVGLFQNGAAASTSLLQFLDNNGPATATLIDDLAELTNLNFQREPAFRALFQVLPLFATNVASTATDGQVRFELAFNNRNTVCPYTSAMASPTSLVALADLTRNCGMQAPDLLQRGADKAPPPQG